MLEMVDSDTPANGPDGPVAVLERRMASLLGKPAAVFFPSGTMTQQVALRIHADRRGRRAFAAHPTKSPGGLGTPRIQRRARTPLPSHR